MGGEVTVYSGLPPTVEAVGGMLDISSKLTPGIDMPRIGGNPPIISEDIMVEDEELEKEEEDMDEEDMLDEPMFIDPIPPIMFFIIPSMSRLFISGIPPIIGIPGIG